MKHDEEAWRIEHIVLKALSDETFRQQLLSDPATSLRAQGVPIPQGVEVRILEDTENVRYLVLPVKPPSEELMEEQLRKYGRPG
jgi:hypothetical protein